MPKSSGYLGVIPEEFAWVVFSFKSESDRFWTENGKKLVKKRVLEAVLNTF